MIYNWYKLSVVLCGDFVEYSYALQRLYNYNSWLNSTVWSAIIKYTFYANKYSMSKASNYRS